MVCCLSNGSHLRADGSKVSQDCLHQQQQPQRVLEANSAVSCSAALTFVFARAGETNWFHMKTENKAHSNRKGRQEARNWRAAWKARGRGLSYQFEWKSGHNSSKTLPFSPDISWAPIKPPLWPVSNKSQRLILTLRLNTGWEEVNGPL